MITYDDPPTDEPGGPLIPGDDGYGRTCPTCGAVMRPAGKRAYICPNQADQGNGISAAAREAVQATKRRRVEYAPF